MALKRYTKDEFLNLLEDKIVEAGSPSNLARQLNVSNSAISQARYGYSRRPSPDILKGLGLRAEIHYVSTGESNATTGLATPEEDLPEVP